MFCPQCGKQADDAAKFCPYCGKPMPQEKVSSDESSVSTSLDSEVCRVTIRRINQFYVYNPKMKIFLDGVEVCAVKNGSTVTVEVVKGTHTLRITSFFRKKQVQISILEDTELVVGWNRLTGGINVKTSAPISGGPFSSKGQDSPDNQNNTPNHPPRGILIGGVAAVAVIIVVALVIIFGSGTASEISTVQNGYLGEYTDMTVKEVLDSYYGLLYQAEGEWISGENADVEGVTMVQVEYSSELIGTAILQFTMLDEQCFEITYIDDPMETIEEASDVLAVLNKVYVAAYESQYEQTELAEIEAQLLERLTEVNATSVRYGASAEYDGDRSQLYQMFGDTQLDMSATELLTRYGIVDYSINGLPIGVDGSDYSGTWCSEGTSPWDSGITLELQITDFDDTHWNVVLTAASVSAAPSMRIASLETTARIEKENPIVVQFNDDGWFNEGILTVELREDGLIGISCEITEYDEYVNWDLGMPYTILSPYIAATAEDPFYDNGYSDNSIDLSLSDVLGYYENENGRIEFLLGTGERAGYILNYTGSFGGDEYSFDDITNFTNEDLTEFYFESHGSTLTLTCSAFNEITISCTSDTFGGVPLSVLGGTYYK